VSATIIVAYNASSLFESRVEAGKKDIERIVYQNDLHGSFGQRVGMNIIGFLTFKKSPLFGHGIGDDMDAYRKTANSKNIQQKIGIPIPEHVHDQYLQILLQTGLLGLFMFIMFIWYLIKPVLKYSSGEMTFVYPNICVVFPETNITGQPSVFSHLKKINSPRSSRSCI